MRDPLTELTDIGDLADEIKRLLADLVREHPDAATDSGEFVPDLDVVETASAFQICLDLPGVAPDALRLVAVRGTLVVAGRKMPPDLAAGGGATFHRIEREFGRFARAIRLPGAADVARAKATLRTGELCIVVPKPRGLASGSMSIPIT